MPDPAALDARAHDLRVLADDVDGCVDRGSRHAGTPSWQCANAEDVRAGLRHARSRARTAADALRAEARSAAQDATAERDRRDAERREQERDAERETPAPQL